MFVNGLSTEKVGATLEQLSGIKLSPSTVSRVFQTLDAEFESWKKRRLKARYLYVFADGTYFTVIYTDGNQAMLNAVQAKFSASKRQRCIKPKMNNILGYVPEKQQEQVHPELHAIFYQENRQKAVEAADAFQLKYESAYPTAIECMKQDWEACLTFYDFPKTHWKYIRTTNIIELSDVQAYSDTRASSGFEQWACFGYGKAGAIDVSVDEIRSLAVEHCGDRLVKSALKKSASSVG